MAVAMARDRRVRDRERLVLAVIKASFRRSDAWSALARNGVRKARSRGNWCEFRLVPRYLEHSGAIAIRGDAGQVSPR